MREPAIDLATILARVVAAVQAEGARLDEEFHQCCGPRGEGGKAPIDVAIELSLRGVLQGLLPCTFVGEETGTTPGPLAGWHWLVDPQDGTREFIKRIPGSAVSVALLRAARPVLAAVHSPVSPGGGRDTFAWAEGCGPLQRNGAAVRDSLAGRRLAPGARVWAAVSAGKRADFFRRRIAPAELVTLPSIAHRLARVAAGEGVAAITVHPIAEHDIAAGAALVRAAGGEVLDAQGRAIEFSSAGTGTYSGCFAGAPDAAAALARADWESR